MSVPARLALFNIAVFLVLGMQLPFWPLWLKGRGLSESEIGALIAISLIMRIIAAPIAGAVADEMGERRRPMIVLSLLALASFCLFLVVDGFWPILLVTLLVMSFYPALIPMIEAVTVTTARLRGFDYARLRIFGSAAFVAMNVAGGIVLARMGAEGILYAVLMLLIFMLGAAFLIPGEKALGLGGKDGAQPKKAPRFEGAALRAVVSSPLFWLFAMSCGLIQGAHGLYYSFSAIHWRHLGFSGDVIGVLWGIGVVSEIVLFFYIRRVLARITPMILIFLGGAGAVLRWVIMSFDPGLGALVAVQCLHALSFGATHIGTVYMIDRAIPQDYAVTAQSVYSGMAMGVITGVVTFGSGALYASFAGVSYAAMAVLSAGGLLGLVILQRVWNGGFLIAPPQVGPALNPRA